MLCGGFSRDIPPEIKKWVDWAIDRSWDGPVDQLAIDKNNLTEHGMEQIFRFTSKVHNLKPRKLVCPRKVANIFWSTVRS